MSDGDTPAKLAELLRHPDDLFKVAALKADYIRKKTAIDSQLKLGLNEQLQVTKSGMNSLHDAQRLTNLIKDEMMKIDRLCAEAQTMIRNFPEINAVAQTHRNFAQVDELKKNIENFDEKIDELNNMIAEDEEDLSNQPNLIKIHYGLSQLRNIRDEAMDQVTRADDHSLEGSLEEHFQRLDDAIDGFDSHVGTACMNLIPLVQQGNTSLIVRLAIVIEEEEKFDTRIKELQAAQQEYKGLASRFQSLNTGPKQLRGYKDKFLEAIKLHAQEQIDGSDRAFTEDPDKLEKSVRWYFNDLNTVKLGMVNLMPKKWRIFKTYVDIYHQEMHAWLQSKASDPSVLPTHMLAIIHWKEKYYSKMEKLGVLPTDMSPLLPGGNDSDLVREYRQLIVSAVEKWMAQMNKTDRAEFLERKETALEHDEHGYFRTKTLGDMWRMLREQLIVASSSELTQVTEGVIDAMFRALKARQDTWLSLVDDELKRYTKPVADPEGIQGLQDWLIALANDQIVCIINPDDEPASATSPTSPTAVDPNSTTTLGYLSSFRRDYESLVTSAFSTSAESRFDALRAGFTDLGFRCVAVFAKLMFAIDFRAVLPDFFTPQWYAKPNIMRQITYTYEDYLNDYASTVPELLHDILIEELAKQLLLAYLGCVHNKGARFRRTDPFAERMRADVVAVFAFFEKFPGSYDAIREQWRVVEGVLRLVEVEKSGLVEEFVSFMGTYWDVRISWVEAVLRAREDVDWGPLGDGKGLLKAIRARVAETKVVGERGDTVMCEID